MSPLPAFVLVVLANPNVADVGTYTVFADGREIASFEMRGKGTEVPKIRIEVPANAERLTIERRASLPVIGMKFRAFHKTSISSRSPSYHQPLRDDRPVISLAGLPEAATSFSRHRAKVTAQSWDSCSAETQRLMPSQAAEASLGHQARSGADRRRCNDWAGEVRRSGMTCCRDLVTTDRQFVRFGAPGELSRQTLATSINLNHDLGRGGRRLRRDDLPPEGAERCGGGPAYWQDPPGLIDGPMPISGPTGGCGSLADALDVL